MSFQSSLGLDFLGAKLEQGFAWEGFAEGALGVGKVLTQQMRRDQAEKA